MKTLSETLGWATENKKALGHFNFSDLATFKAVVDGARELSVPVMLGLSDGERGFVGAKEAVALVFAARQSGAEVYLNSDHTHTLEGAIEAARAGFDEVIFDASKLPIDENINKTKAAINVLRDISPNLLIEAEIGFIGANSQIVDVIPEESRQLTTPADAKYFMDSTGADILAPAVGTMHGMLKSMAQGQSHKRLDIGRIKAIKEAVNTPLTLHGGSGTLDDDFVASIDAGITIIHVSTELRYAWRKGLENSLSTNPNELAPYKIIMPSYEQVKAVVKNRLALFNRL